MVKFENTEVIGWEAAIRGMRNPMNSWERSDSNWFDIQDEDCPDEEWMWVDEGQCDFCYGVGPNDQDLMMRLAKAGTEHAKYRRMIVVYVDITAPLYWWKEFDTYKVGTVANSCSTMHKIAEKEFTIDDFSHEHLDGNSEHELNLIVKWLNSARESFLKTNSKDHWWHMIQLLPSSYNQRRTVMLNYEVLAAIYRQRKNHKLDEWSVGFMDWIRSLPYSKIITGELLND